MPVVMKRLFGSPSLAQRLLTAVIRLYRLLLSPWLGSACRFEPTCSVYALHALDEHGAVGGSCLAAKRVLRCHPWCAGGHDPVPTRQHRASPADPSGVAAGNLIRPSAPVLTEKIPS